MFYSRQISYIQDAPTGFNVEYESIMLCDNTLYNRVPMDSSSIYILNPSLTGLSSGDVLDLVSEALHGGIPINNKVYCKESGYISPDGFNNNLFFEFMGIFGLVDVLQFPYWKWCGNKRTSPDIGVGDLELNSGVQYTESFTCLGVNKWPLLGGNDATLVSYPDPTHSSHLRVIFDVFPEGLVNNGTFDSGAFTSGTVADTVRYCRCNLEVWRYVSGEMEGKYNCFITMTGHDRNDGDWLNVMDGEPSGTIINPNRPDDPNQNNNNNGGNGDGDNGPGDNIQPPELPDTDMTDVGSIRIYAPDKGELTSFMTYLHSCSPGDSLVKLWQNPIQGVISVHYLPYPLRLKGNTKENIGFVGLSSGVNAYPAEQFQTINFGSVYIGTNKNNYLDRSPYTRVQIYLPGIGIRELNTDDVMGKTLWVTYNCDNVSGQCSAFVLAGTSENNRTVKYSYSGSLAAPFPISQNNWGNTYIAAATLAAGALAAGVSMAGAAAGAAAGGASAGGAAAGAAAGEAAGGVTAAGAAGMAMNVGTGVTSLAKPSVSRSGTVSGTTSLFSIRKPYVIIERPNVIDVSDLNKLRGYPCAKTYKLGDITGYTEIEKVHLKNIIATAEELNEIEALLKSGVHL